MKRSTHEPSRRQLTEARATSSLAGGATLQLSRFAVLLILVTLIGPPVPVRATNRNRVNVQRAPAAPSRAYSTRWKSRVRLGPDLSAINAQPFTMMARFFPIYRLPHFGAVLSASGPTGKFSIGQGLVTTAKPDTAKPALALMIDGR